VGSATGTARGAIGGAANGAGGLAGSAAGSAAGTAGGAQGSLAAAGSAAANAAGSVSVAPGMIVRDGAGRAIGEVQNLRTTANGAVDMVMVAVGDRVTALPADNFTVDGGALVSAMSRGEVRKEAREQEKGETARR
jgi:hypothetical protein